MKILIRNILITVSLITLFFIIFTFRYEKTGFDKIVVLDDINFNEDILSSDREEKMTLEKVDKVPFNEECDSCDFIDDENIVYASRNSKDTFLDVNDEKLNYFQLNKFNLKSLKEEKIKPVHNKSQRFIISSPDKKRIFYSEGDEILQREIKIVEKNKSFIYNVKDKENINISYKTFVKWMPDSSGYIGMKSTLFFQDLNNNTTKEILEAKQLKNIGNIHEISVAKDCKNIFIQSFKSDEEFNSYIYHLNLDKPYKLNLIFKGNINKIEGIDGDNFIFSGKFWGDKALYLYNIKTKDIKTILNEEVILFKLSNDRKNIAYVVKDKEGNNTLYAAKIYKNSISHSVMLYKNLNIKNSTLNWSEDNNKLIAAFYENKEEKSKMYIFYFK
ncbi:hypothetical protein BD780_002702 [Clostridium tetanomorphum]|uniref:hypothetical protein n=1 Tax=Clostridium tetanomorphum TaxID=1553 RepID=UPI00044FC714|nr:hypothetical protein [Clostridium tetanomorphum]KAJ50608.1 hypothetical protein CTM_16727 [Clostridium tetanomorphum DSM 665]MBP1862683.1 hypothetical protein [Clostridium tetanomorphum]NRS85477.1 hypothetical protein [Clostridium tetanomorphum]SQC02805.1 Uncharacterised protein [Clostridium tetanomorphum]